MIVDVIKNEAFKVDKILGYSYTYLPSHALANRSGKVYEHIYVAVINMGRFLDADEVVHHKDRDRLNNSWDNLIVMTNSAHMKLHQLEDGKTPEEVECRYCNVKFFTRLERKPKVCSSACAAAARFKFEIEPDKLFELVWTYPTTTVAKMLGVSDVAVAKRCKKFNIEKPPRGYWAKKGHHSCFSRKRDDYRT